MIVFQSKFRVSKIVSSGLKVITEPVFLELPMAFTFLTGLVYLIHAWWRWSKRTRLHLPLESSEEKKLQQTGSFFSSAKLSRLRRLRLTHRHGGNHYSHTEAVKVPKLGAETEDVFSRLRAAALLRKPVKVGNVFENLDHLAEFTKKAGKKYAKKIEAGEALQRLRKMSKNK